MLLVPIHLDALVLDEDKMVVEAMADFSRLPYCDGKADINPDVANISEEIVSPLFQNQNLPLKAGIHLHWSLPDALTRSRHKSDGQDFPRVPNRWLVTRTGDGGKEWIVESDYLHPAGEDHSATSVAIPYRRDDRARPFRYMGRTMPLSDWPKNETKPECYPTLTAVGYGEPTFAAFYPNCHSVFGFYDPASFADVKGKQYEVIGWYSHPKEDFLGEFLLAINKKVTTNDARIKALEDDFKWTLKLDDNHFPSQMLCYASLVIGEVAKDEKLDKPTTIAVGNTGTEALSAYLADQLDGSKTNIEDQLEAIQLSAKLEHRQLDIDTKFLEARHEKGFNAISGGTLWTIRPESTTTSAADVGNAQTEITLPDEMAQPLNAVNDLQQEYDRACQELESSRKQLFSDWYKYMLCAYPPEDARDEYPDIDEVKSYIEVNVDPLNKRIAQTGTLTVNDENGNISASVDCSAPASLAAELAAAVNELQGSVTTHNLKAENANSALRLKQISGPRYWQPTEPVVLIQGALVKASERHGQDGRSSDGLLETQILNADITDQGAANLRKNNLRKIRDKVFKEVDPTGNFAFSKWDKQPWNPFLLEWEVEVFPLANKSNLDPKTRRYASDFISDNFTVSENQVDLSLKPDNGAITTAANIYSGRSILTPHAGIRLKKQIEAYLMPRYYRAKSIPVTQQGTAFLDQHIDVVQTWYETNASSPNQADADTASTAIGAYKALMSLDCLSQSLGGFNEALLMHKQTMQLAISDPLGFDDYQDFAKSVGAAVSNSIYSAPEPLNDFNPIRSGAMKIIQLRLVDTFGQIKDLALPEEVITSEPMTNPDSDFHVRLAPRLVQPARINFRWLAADSDEQEMNDHPATTPICGWLLTNKLDNSLMIYDNQGRALGSLDENAVWESAPGGGPDAVNQIDGIGNPHLKKMVAHIKGCGAGFLEQFISAVDNALENIEPENFSQHQDIALLMGRPIALVRASVNLELQGLPAVHQGWNEFRQDLQRDTRDDNGFSEVKFPIRIGDFKQFNDGLVGYWQENADAGKSDWFYAPQSDDEQEITDARIKTHRTAANDVLIFQSVKSAPNIPSILSMLIDPRGLVHATSGVLPAKAISIPPDQYTAALQAIEITFLSTPILTDVGKMHLPLPAEAGYQWSWLQQDGPGGVIPKSAFAKFGSEAAGIWDELIGKGWIELIVPTDPKDPKATVKAKDQRTSQTLAENLKDKTTEIEDILDQWTEISSRGIVQTKSFAEFENHEDVDALWTELIAQGWIVIDPNHQTRASVAAKDQRKSQSLSLPDNLKDKTADIEDILDRAHLGPINPAAKFSGPQEIREGWLKLSADKISANSKAQAAADTVIANPKQ
jgi:hypothetical protein